MSTDRYIGRNPDSDKLPWNEDRYRWPILIVCEHLHGEYSGAWQDCNIEELQEQVNWLKWRLETWKPGHDKYQEFDETVRKLCEMALREGECALGRCT